MDAGFAALLFQFVQFDPDQAPCKPPEAPSGIACEPPAAPWRGRQFYAARFFRPHRTWPAPDGRRC
jgi:hypothetical protein